MHRHASQDPELGRRDAEDVAEQGRVEVHGEPVIGADERDAEREGGGRR